MKSHPVYLGYILTLSTETPDDNYDPALSIICHTLEEAKDFIFYAFKELLNYDIAWHDIDDYGYCEAIISPDIKPTERSSEFNLLSIYACIIKSEINGDANPDGHDRMKLGSFAAGIAWQCEYYDLETEGYRG